MPKYYMEGVLTYQHDDIIEAPNKEVAEIKFLQSLSESLVFMSTPDKDGGQPSFVLDDGYTDIEVCNEILTSKDDDVTVAS